MIEQSSKEVADYLISLPHDEFMKLLDEHANGAIAILWKEYIMPHRQEDTE